MSKIEPTEEMLELWDEHVSSKDLRDLYVKVPFCHKKAVKSALKSTRARRKFWNKFWDLYPDEGGTVKHFDAYKCEFVLKEKTDE